MQGLWSGEVIIRAEGGIHGNPVSDHQQRHRHAVKMNGILTNPIVTRIGAGGGVVVREGKAFNVAEEVDELHSPVSKLMQSNHEKQATKPIQEMIRPYPIRFTLFDHTNVLNIMRKKKAGCLKGHEQGIKIATTICT